MTKRIHTPWGQSDHEKTLADGITFYGTPRHGGIRLSDERRQALAAIFPDWDQTWFEEDCEISVVMLAFADEMTDSEVRDSIQCAEMVNSWESSSARWQAIVDWTQAPAQQGLRDRAERERQRVARFWERGSMGSMVPAGVPKECWSVSFRRPNDKGGFDRRTCFMPYPEKRYYTDDELKELHHPAPVEIEKHKSGFPQSCVQRDDFDYMAISDADPGL